MAIENIDIGPNGNWFINGVDTGTTAVGVPGPPGANGSQGIKGIRGEKGDAGDTTPEFLALAAQVNADAIAAEQSAEDANTAWSQAQTASQAATAQASIATSQAADASQAATDAIAAAENAEGQAGIATAQASAAATSATQAATSASQAAGAVSGMLGANNNWTGTNTFQAPVTLNNASVLAPNATTSLTGVATAASMLSFYCTLWGQTAPVRDITNISNAADTQVSTALESGVTPFALTGNGGSFFVSNSPCAVGVQGFLVDSAGGGYVIKHATISAMTTPLTLTLGATVYTKPASAAVNVPLVLRRNRFGVYFSGTETQSPQVATSHWLNLWFRKVTSGGAFYIYVGNTNAI